MNNVCFKYLVDSEVIGKTAFEKTPDIFMALHNNENIAHWIFTELQKTWPQINRQTKIQYVDEYRSRVEIAYGGTIVLDINTKWVSAPISGWRKLRSYLFPSRYVWDNLDDPAQRQKYQDGLVRAFLNLPVPMFWRVTGRIFRKKRWHNRGMGNIPDLNAVAPTPLTETVELKLFTMVFPYGRHQPEYLVDPNTNYYANTEWLYCGYHPRSDTLCIGRR